ncbi:MAG: Crp/Fnr family transcriptional regulator [Chloroflexi bacterium]|nr:Crp/Fnr family transcriptional regulator [Chloroflexota bacterium]
MTGIALRFSASCGEHAATGKGGASKPGRGEVGWCVGSLPGMFRIMQEVQVAPRNGPTIHEILRSVPLLRGLTETQLVDMGRLARTHRFEREEIVFLQGDPGDSVHVILNGEVKVVVTSRAGHEAILAFLGEGESFGEMSLLDDLPRSATIQATAPTTTLSLRKTEFHRLLRDAPDVSLRLLRALARRLRESGMLVQDAAFLDVGERLAKKLLAMAFPDGDDAGTRARLVPPVELRVTQQDLASMIGATRESVNKALSNYRSRGTIAIARNRVILNDIDALRRIVDASFD